MPILVLKEKPGEWTSANVLPQKGVTDYTVLRLLQEIKILGYKRFIFKSDQEEAIIALKKRVQQEWGEDMMLEESPVGESQANGEAENAINMVKAKVRTMRLYLQSRYKTISGRCGEKMQCRLRGAVSAHSWARALSVTTQSEFRIRAISM